MTSYTSSFLICETVELPALRNSTVKSPPGLELNSTVMMDFYPAAWEELSLFLLVLLIASSHHRIAFLDTHILSGFHQNEAKLTWTDEPDRPRAGDGGPLVQATAPQGVLSLN